VTAGRRQLEGAPAAFLAANIGEVQWAPARLPVTDGVLRWLELAAEIRDRIGKVAHADRLDARQGRLGARLVRADDPLELRAPRTFGNREHTADTAQSPVQGEFAARRVLGETRAGKLVRRRENS
jgi:hypothetical protein